MHYIRLLRPAKFDASDRRRPLVSLLVTVTTDLGDSFLYTNEPVDLVVSADDAVGTSILSHESEGQPYRWTAGMRVLDIKVPVKSHLKKGDVTCTINIQQVTRPKSFGALRSDFVLPWGIRKGSTAVDGLIMPVSVHLVAGVCEPVSVRPLQLNTGYLPSDQLNVELEEDIGESIARHIWDAGVVTACFLAGACKIEYIRNALPISKDTFNVLELGSGVGILGITLARIIERAAAIQGKTLSEATILLTDLEEAEERARSNIARTEATLSCDDGDGSVVTLQYENLDWDEGKHGRFGPLVSARPWDLVILSDCTYNVDSLPALIGTLSALHTSNLNHMDAEKDAKTSVMLATKPRHSSEQALFGLLDADGWRYSVLRSIPLPKLGEEGEVVDIYSLEKGAP
ncbi:putative methyltransferase-domain-containing protein [Hypoxylon trugodes]|uniref:putative methyltransferase-domain-containing protein n=1 Tax=Hypoxylon trugodes TaxID=326681 RepID=UPI00219286B5|nr:putative methyltransferase-domain-containing protein [Hypoxylon trugodes]KAI1385530.1 putative methyltransferase-domain-containing protein [Hypoxylon trugodes]